jgi:hypothetical protein
MKKTVIVVLKHRSDGMVDATILRHHKVLGHDYASTPRRALEAASKRAGLGYDDTQAVAEYVKRWTNWTAFYNRKETQLHVSPSLVVDIPARGKRTSHGRSR